MLRLRDNNTRYHSQVEIGSRIYYNLKFANIYDNKDEPKEFKAIDNSSTILHKQNNYRLAIESFRLDIVLPVFLFPIKEGFVDSGITISAITQANPAVITTTAPHGLNVNDYIRINNSSNMVQINGKYFVNSVLSPTQITLKNSLTNGSVVDSSRYLAYLGGADISTVNDDINLSDYGLCLEFIGSGNNYTSSVTYIPDKNTTINPSLIPKSPKQNGGVQDKTTFYYYTFSFTAFAEMLNASLQIATDNLNLAEGTSYDPPYYLYGDDGRFSLIVPFDFVGAINIFVNIPLNNLLVGFRTEFETRNSPLFKDFKYVLENYKYSNSYAPPGAVLPAPPVNPDYLSFRQEYDGRYKFDDISSIIITSNYIRTREEFYPKLGNPNSYSVVGKSGNSFNTGTQNIISSFDLIDTEGSVSWREVQYYYPKIYKWTDLISDDPLSKIDAQIYFETKSGDFLPVFVDSSTYSNIRFLFEKIN